MLYGRRVSEERYDTAKNKLLISVVLLGYITFITPLFLAISRYIKIFYSTKFNVQLNFYQNFDIIILFIIFSIKRCIFTIHVLRGRKGFELEIHLIGCATAAGFSVLG